MNTQHLPPRIPLAWRIWLGLGAWAGVGTLGLSALRQSNGLGWLVWAALGLALGGVMWRGEVLGAGRSPRRFGGRLWRFRRGPARWFLVLAIAGGLGGALYEPTNWDTQWYRIPRVLHWLAEQRWHFIASVEGRLNYVAPGLEWLWTPLVAWTGSDRCLFLPNLAGFLLLPGAAWAVFRELGVPARTAWWAMWLLPTAWIYCFQAGSAANDAISTPYLLLAVVLALRAQRFGDLRSLLWSIVAAGLFSNVKQSNLPLGLLWFVPALLSVRLLLRRPVLAVSVALIATAVSFVPVTLMNLAHTGHWMGWSRAEQIWIPQNHLVALAANSVFAVLQTLAPPLLPGADAWNGALRGLATGGLAPYVVGFEDFGNLPRSISETWAGLGLPFAALWLWGWWRARRARPPGCPTDRPVVVWTRRLIWPLLLLLLSQTGTVQLARYLAPYYPFLLVPFLLAPGWGGILRRPGWRWGATAVSLSAVLTVLVSRQRPLLPPLVVTEWLAERGQGAVFWQRWATKQATQQRVHRRFDPLLPQLKSERLIGLAAVSPGETALWQPYAFGPGARQVQHVRSGSDLAVLRAKGLRFVVQDDLGAMVKGARDGLDWARQNGGKIVALVGLTEAEILARRESPRPPSLDDIARNRPGPDGKPPVDVVYLIEWDRP